jgi:cob(I)alamin adenosyltransferase
MTERGRVHINTGNGKGKTTAALGLALRARAHGWRVLWASFHKDPGRWGYREQESLAGLGVDVRLFAPRHPMCDPDVTAAELRTECLAAVTALRDLFAADRYDLVVLDEILISLREGYLLEEEVAALIDARPLHLELVLTGRGAPPGLITKADLVTEMTPVKHYFDQGEAAKQGIEF